MLPHPFESAGEPGHYLSHQPFTDESVLALAAHVARNRLTRGANITIATEAFASLTSLIGLREREVFAVVFLDRRHRIIAWEELFRGSIEAATVHPREVVKAVLRHNAAAVQQLEGSE